MRLVPPRFAGRRVAIVALALSWLVWTVERTDARPMEPAGLTLIEAVELAFDHDPNIAIVRSQVRFAEGSLMVEAGRFDPVVTGTVRQDDPEPAEEDRGASGPSATLETSVGLVRELRSGLVLEPSVDLVRTDGPGPGAVNRSTVRFTVRQPLLRGRGREVVAAQEIAATRELEAARLDLVHAVSVRVAEVVSRYWSLQAAVRSLEILETSERASARLLESTRRLAEADMVPAAEVVLVEADVTAKAAARVAGEQELFAARRALSRAIGLGRNAIDALPLPSDPLPAITPDEVPPSSVAEQLVGTALERRADLSGLKVRSEGDRVLVVAADDALAPRVDLLWTPSYSGLAEGTGSSRYLDPLHEGVGGLGTTVTLSLSWPTANREAEGRLIRNRALLDQRNLETELLVRRIVADVPTALNAVRTGAERLVRASDAVGLFLRAVENERRKLRAGRSTLIDVINQQDRLTAARQAELSAHLALAGALVDLRFQTGTLTELGTGSGSRHGGVVDGAALTTIPGPGGS